MFARPGVIFFLLCAWFCAPAIAADSTRVVEDDSGRQFTVPARIDRVFAAGSPAAITVFTLAPEKLLGWTGPIGAKEAAFMPPRAAALPVLGRLTGRANTANVETVIAAMPDIILDLGDADQTHISLAERIQDQTGIPYLLFNGRLDHTPELYERLGALLGKPEKAAELADYARRTLAELHDGLARVPQKDRPRVYYARGPQGLETALRGSLNAELIDYLGAVNVASAPDRHSLADVSPEQVVAWDPDVIITLDPRFYHSVWTSPVWSGLRAVREQRVYLAPTAPFPWFDEPPAVNRLIGIRWLAALLYPEVFPTDLRAVTRDFYQRFYHVELTDAQLDQLLKPAR